MKKLPYGIYPYKLEELYLPQEAWNDALKFHALLNEFIEKHKPEKVTINYDIYDNQLDRIVISGEILRTKKDIDIQIKQIKDVKKLQQKEARQATKKRKEIEYQTYLKLREKYKEKQ